MEPFTIKGGSTLAFKLHDIVRRNAVSELSQFEVLTIFAYIDGPSSTTQAKKYQAILDSGCTITPQSLGGSAYVDFPVEINLSGNRKFGETASYSGSSITFTEVTNG